MKSQTPKKCPLAPPKASTPAPKPAPAKAPELVEFERLQKAVESYRVNKHFLQLLVLMPQFIAGVLELPRPKVSVELDFNRPPPIGDGLPR